MEKRYQVFVSSTFEDLKEERQAALKAVLEMDHMPAGMELFPAGEDSAWRLICDVIDSSDYYALIIGGRYGSLDEAGIGYTEKEYDYAVTKKKPVVSLLHGDPDNLPRGKTETSPTAWSKLQAFRSKVEKQHTCAYWRTPEELRAQLIVALTATMKRHPAQGWVRAGSLASEEASREILELHRMVEQQRAELDRQSSTPPEGADLLAQGTDQFRVEGRATLTRKNVPWNSKDRFRYATLDVNVFWDELFGAFAPILVNAAKESQMKYQISRHIKDKVASRLEQKNLGFKVTGFSMPDTLFQTIKVQFIALGLLDVRNEMRQTEASTLDIRLVELTPRGKRHLVKVKAITKGQEQSNIALEPAMPIEKPRHSSRRPVRPS